MSKYTLHVQGTIAQICDGQIKIIYKIFMSEGEQRSNHRSIVKKWFIAGVQLIE